MTPHRYSQTAASNSSSMDSGSNTPSGKRRYSSKWVLEHPESFGEFDSKQNLHHFHRSLQENIAPGHDANGASQLQWSFKHYNAKSLFVHRKPNRSNRTIQPFLHNFELESFIPSSSSSSAPSSALSLSSSSSSPLSTQQITISNINNIMLLGEDEEYQSYSSLKRNASCFQLDDPNWSGTDIEGIEENNGDNDLRHYHQYRHPYSDVRVTGFDSVQQIVCSSSDYNADLTFTKKSKIEDDDTPFVSASSSSFLFTHHPPPHHHCGFETNSNRSFAAEEEEETLNFSFCEFGAFTVINKDDGWESFLVDDMV